MTRDSRSWLDKAMTGAFSALVIAGVLFIAVKLIEAVLTALLVMLGISLLVVTAAALFRARHRDW